MGQSTGTRGRADGSIRDPAITREDCAAAAAAASSKELLHNF